MAGPPSAGDEASFKSSYSSSSSLEDGLAASSMPARVASPVIPSGMKPKTPNRPFLVKRKNSSFIARMGAASLIDRKLSIEIKRVILPSTSAAAGSSKASKGMVYCSVSGGGLYARTDTKKLHTFTKTGSASKLMASGHSTPRNSAIVSEPVSPPSPMTSSIPVTPRRIMPSDPTAEPSVEVTSALLTPTRRDSDAPSPVMRNKSDDLLTAIIESDGSRRSSLASSTRTGLYASFAGKTFALSPGRPNFEVFLITLAQERKKKDRVLGYVELPLRDMNSGVVVQSEYNLQPKTTSSKHHVSGEVHVKLLYAKSHPGKPDALHLQVLEASNLAPREGSAANPCVSICIGDTVHKTKVVKGTTHPQFNERFVVPVDEDKVASFTVLVNHVVRRNKDAFLGQVVFPLSDLQPNVVQDCWLKLNPRVYDEVSYSGYPALPGAFGRVKVKFMYTEDITLPLLEYKPLCELLFGGPGCDDHAAVRLLCSLTISSKSMATALVDVGLALFRTHPQTGKADGRLIDMLDVLLSIDVASVRAHSSTIFRANTISSLAVSHLLRRAGGPSLPTSTARSLSGSLLSARPRPTALALLTTAINDLLGVIFASINSMPRILRELFARVYRIVLDRPAAAGPAAGSTAAHPATDTETSLSSSSSSGYSYSDSYSYSDTESASASASASSAQAGGSPVGARAAGRASARDALALQAVSAFVILRFFAPALLTPKVYGIDAEVPMNKPLYRTLARALQKIGNMLLFDGRKNPMLVVINPVLASHFASMTQFLRAVSEPAANCIDPATRPPLDACLESLSSARKSHILNMRTNLAFILGRLLDARADGTGVDSPAMNEVLDSLSSTLARISSMSSSQHMTSKEFKAANRKLATIGNLAVDLKSSFAGGSDTSSMVLEFRMRKRITSGNQFTLHTKGKTKPVFVACVIADNVFTLVYKTRISSSDNLVSLGATSAPPPLSRSSSGGAIDMTQIIDVVKGQVTETFSKSGKLEQQHRSFSVLTADGDSLDLDAATEKERNDWVAALRHYVKKARLAAKNSGADLPSGPHRGPFSSKSETSKSKNKDKDKDKTKGKAKKAKAKAKNKDKAKGKAKAKDKDKAKDKAKDKDKDKAKAKAKKAKAKTKAKAKKAKVTAADATAGVGKTAGK
ncbi:uncharacterized protein AMSG_07869 [Thecamonas trahens ATCC 50062]|uniref:Uncharacterized protein n=1 Tax=Thecamonas trahens ATCC 50062 TaxID=461836 RepID=A0A0L0DHU1_THETB|nr:hypothetical protein AMSG_07869 [Thecamonas trahens ATCC 50062]KNC51795.1 hypothetical protein AMSG_07869 [Thecamonas trahens ATCC 50062]|eukprot:XP_013755664.1 hypothetical protein AMSG_07869 [Thecamonas trahens ATCC 50062]